MASGSCTLLDLPDELLIAVVLHVGAKSRVLCRRLRDLFDAVVEELAIRRTSSGAGLSTAATLKLIGRTQKLARLTLPWEIAFDAHAMLVREA